MKPSTTTRRRVLGVAAAAAAAGRSPADIRLILVSKTVAPARIRAALALGETLLGENKAQELREKAPLLRDTPARWHFIGQLQSNKLKDVLPWVEMIHSLDRLSLAEKLSARLTAEQRQLQVLVQVNTSHETSKGGVAPEQALELIQRVAESGTQIVMAVHDADDIVPAVMHVLKIGKGGKAEELTLRPSLPPHTESRRRQ